MIQIRIERFAYCPWGTYGRMFVPGQTGALWTVECPWLDNRPFVSCIPFGTYQARPEKHARFGWVLRVADVPGRTGILVHRGNKPSDFSGCIGVGKTGQKFVGEEWAVGDSLKAMEILEGIVGEDDVAVEVYGGVLQVAER